MCIILLPSYTFAVRYIHYNVIGRMKYMKQSQMYTRYRQLRITDISPYSSSRVLRADRTRLIDARVGKGTQE